MPLHNATASTGSTSMLSVPVLQLPQQQNNRSHRYDQHSPSVALAAAAAAAATSTARSGARLCPFDQRLSDIRRNQQQNERRQYSIDDLIQSISTESNHGSYPNNGVSARGSRGGGGGSSGGRGRRLRSQTDESATANPIATISTATAATSTTATTAATGRMGANTNSNNNSVDIFHFLHEGHDLYHAAGVNMANDYANDSTNISSSSPTAVLPPSSGMMLSNFIHELHPYSLSQPSSDFQSTSAAAAAAAAAAAMETDSLWPDSHDVHDDDVISVNSEVFEPSPLGENGESSGLGDGECRRSSTSAVAAAAAAAVASRDAENNIRSMENNDIHGVNGLTTSSSTRARRSLCTHREESDSDDDDDGDSICVIEEREGEDIYFNDIVLHSVLMSAPTPQPSTSRTRRSRRVARGSASSTRSTAADAPFAEEQNCDNSARLPTATARASSLATLSSSNHAAERSVRNPMTRATRHGTTRRYGSSSSAPSQPSDMTSSRRITRSYRKRNINEISSNDSLSEATPGSTTTNTQPSKKLASDCKQSASTKDSSSENDKPKVSTKSKTSEKDKEDKESKKCCICLEIPKKSDLAQLDGCSHTYCFDCIDQWAQRENTCPQCKKKFFEIKRVHKIKTNKRKRDGSSVNTKKVKDRDQRSDYRQSNHLQRVFAQIEAHGLEAHGLGVLLSSTNGFFPGIPSLANRSRRVIPGAALARPTTLATTVRGPPSTMSTIEQLLGGRRLHGSSTNTQEGSPLASSGTSEDSNSPLHPTSFIPRRSARALSRRAGRYNSATLSRNNTATPISDSLYYRAIPNARRGQGSDLNSSTASNRRNASSSSTTAAQQSSPLSSISASSRSNNLLSMNDVLTASDYRDAIFSISQRQPRSFASNFNQVGAGVSADTPLEILDDSDEDDSASFGY